MKRKFSLLVASIFMAAMSLTGCNKKCEHDYVGVMTLSPTCVVEGVKTFTCSKCNDSYTEQIEALGHNLANDAKKEPTCTEKGHEAGKHCTRCEYVEGGETIAATGKHTPNTYGFCKDCNDYLGQTVNVGVYNNITTTDVQYFKVTYATAKEYKFTYGYSQAPTSVSLNVYHKVGDNLELLVNKFSTSFNVAANETVYVVFQQEGSSQISVRTICAYEHRCNDFGECLDCKVANYSTGSQLECVANRTQYYRFPTNNSTKVKVNIKARSSDTFAEIIKVIKYGATEEITADLNGLYAVDKNSYYFVVYKTPTTGMYEFSTSDYSNYIGVITDAGIYTGHGTFITIDTISNSFKVDDTIWVKYNDVYTEFTVTAIKFNDKALEGTEVDLQNVNVLLRGAEVDKIATGTIAYLTNPNA